RCNGQGRYCEMIPAKSGPRPNPPMFAAAASMAALDFLPRGANSITAMVAVAVNKPADNPDSARPSSNTHNAPPKRNSNELATEHTNPAASIGRRPTWSDQGPVKMSAPSTPNAYVAKM